MSYLLNRSSSTYIVSVDNAIRSIFISLHLSGVPATHHAGQQVGDGADEAALGGGGEGCERQRQQDQTSHPSSASGSGFTLSCQWTV